MYKLLQQGVSLVELMVAMALSLVLLAGVVQIYVGSKQSFNVNDSLSRVQENARVAMDFLARDIRMADFWGCVTGATNLNNDVNGGGSLDITLGGLSGSDNGGLNGSDSIRLQGAYGSGIIIEAPFMNTNAAALHVSADNGLSQSDIVMVSDCSSADIFQISNANPDTSGTVDHNTGNATSPGNATGDLSKVYAGDAELYKVRSVTYSIQAGPNGEPALFRNDGTNNLELVNGVENMQVFYGEDTSNTQTADYYVPAGDVTDMENVVSVKIVLLLRSHLDNVTTGGSQTYNYYTNNAASAISANDNRLRQTYTSTIAICSRVP